MAKHIDMHNYNKSRLGYELDQALAQGYAVWKQSDLDALGIKLDQIFPWLKEWERQGILKMSEDDTENLFEVLQFSYDLKIMFRRRVNNFFYAGEKTWSKSEIMDDGFELSDIMPWLNAWEEQGCITIFDTEDIFFEVRKPLSK